MSDEGRYFLKGGFMLIDLCSDTAVNKLLKHEKVINKIKSNNGS